MQPGVFYDPGDAFTVHAGDADMNGYIHMQAVYEKKDESYRRPEITNLTLDANGGYLTDGQQHPLTANMDLSHLTDWVGFGRISATKSYIDDNNQTHQVDWIEFGDIQSNKSIHLYRYATDITHINGDPSLPLLPVEGTNYFGHPQNYLLIGFDDTPNEGDGVATYTADSVIAITRTDRKTLYAVWEPMVYINFVNNASSSVHLSLTSTDALTIVNTKNSLYGRIPMSASDLADIEVEPGKRVRLAIPNGEEKTVKVEVTNQLGVGKELSWNTSLTYDGQTYDTATTGANINFEHASGDVHTLTTGTLRNQESAEFNNKLLFEKDGITITFSEEESDFALILDDNYPEGTYREIDFSREQVNDRESALLPGTNSRSGGYHFLGWAYSPTATAADYSPTSPSGAPWTIQDLYEFYYNTPQLNKQTVHGNTQDTIVATLYAV